MRLVAMTLVLASCGVRVSCGHEFTWRGLPAGASCTHGESLDELRCVVDGAAYLCVRDWEMHVVQCAPMKVMR